VIQIGVIGGHRATRRQEAWAERLGAFIAKLPAILVCGGLGGIMAAAAKGAKKAGGLTVGILPGDDKTSANPHISLAIPTGIGLARNIMIVRSADMIFAIGGGPGTLSEIAYAMQLEVPVIGIDTWDVGRWILKAATPAEAESIATSVLKARNG